MSDIVLNAAWWFFVVTGGFVWFAVALIVGSLLWAKWKQKRQARRERLAEQKPWAAGQRLTTLESRADGHALRINAHEERIKQLIGRVEALEQAREEARKVMDNYPIPEAKQCSPKRKTRSTSTKNSAS